MLNIVINLFSDTYEYVILNLLAFNKFKVRVIEYLELNGKND